MKTEIFSEKLELILSKCKFTQVGVDVPKTFTGKGIVRQCANGDFTLTMFIDDNDNDDVSGDLLNLFGYYSKNGLDGGFDPVYFDFEAIDFCGNKWKAERGIIDYCSKSVITTRLMHLAVSLNRYDNDLEVAYYSRWVFKGNINLPWHNEYIVNDVIHYVFEFDNDEFSWSVIMHENEFVASFSDKKIASNLTSSRFLYGLEILTGTLIEPVLSFHKSINDNNEVVVIGDYRSVKTGFPQLPQPLSFDVLGEEDMHEFLRKFVIYKEENNLESLSILHNFWWRIIHSKNDQMENSSLVLCVAIEGMLNLCRKSFLSIVENDNGFMELIETTKSLIDDLKIDDRIKKCLSSSLTHASHPNSSLVIDRLIARGFITRNHKKAWKHLRNKCAHGSSFDHNKIQQYNDLYTVCLDMFYIMIFLIIGYSGGFLSRGNNSRNEIIFYCGEATVYRKRWNLITIMKDVPI